MLVFHFRFVVEEVIPNEHDFKLQETKYISLLTSLESVGIKTMGSF